MQTAPKIVLLRTQLLRYCCLVQPAKHRLRSVFGITTILAFDRSYGCLLDYLETDL
jgi:hypothetical protein